MTNDEITYKTAYFNSKAKTVTNVNELHQEFKTSEEENLNKIATWPSEGSGWTVDKIDNHYINVVSYSPLKGSSYIQLPKELQNSEKGLINMKNKDDECFRRCHIRHLNPQSVHPERIKKVDKMFVNELDYSNIEFPVDVKQYNKIEKQNSININVFGYEDKQPFPIYVSKEKFDDQMNLLLITEGGKKHYILIKDFHKSMYHQTNHKERKHFCMHCLQCFSSEKILNKHKTDCMVINGEQAIKMPEKGETIVFQNHHKQLPVPFVIYADFEAITEKIQGCRPNNDESYTEA